MIPLMDHWWAWGIAAVVLFILEVLAPGYILLGFGVGAACVAGLLLLDVGPWLTQSVPMMLISFAGLSLLAWLAMRRIFGKKGGSVKTFDHDINDG